MPAATSYHHGDLRNALVESALELLVEGGLDAVTLRAVARRAGVSHAAPYHHFADKSALAEALAVHGFEQLTAALRAALATQEGDALEGFRQTGVAYGAFALDNEALFRMMNRAEMRRGAPVVEASQACYQVVEDAITRCQQQDLMPEGDPAPFARTAWSAIHGAVVLLLDGMMERPRGTSATAVFDEITMVLGCGFLRRG